MRYISLESVPCTFWISIYFLKQWNRSKEIIKGSNLKEVNLKATNLQRQDGKHLLDSIIYINII